MKDFWGKRVYTKKAVQRFVIFTCMMSLVACTLYKGIKYGNAAVDDSEIFEQYTVNKGCRTFTFSELDDDDRVLDTMKLAFYSARQDSIYI